MEKQTYELIKLMQEHLGSFGPAFLMYELKSLGCQNISSLSDSQKKKLKEVFFRKVFLSLPEYQLDEINKRLDLIFNLKGDVDVDIRKLIKAINPSCSGDLEKIISCFFSYSANKMVFFRSILTIALVVVFIL